MMSKHELRTTHYLQALQPASYVMWHNDTGPDISLHVMTELLVKLKYWRYVIYVKEILT